MSLETGLTLTLTDGAGSETASCDWGEAADRLVDLWGYTGDAPSVYDYARAHRILQAIFGVPS